MNRFEIAAERFKQEDVFSLDRLTLTPLRESKAVEIIQNQQEPYSLFLIGSDHGGLAQLEMGVDAEDAALNLVEDYTHVLGAIEKGTFYESEFKAFQEFVTGFSEMGLTQTDIIQAYQACTIEDEEWLTEIIKELPKHDREHALSLAWTHNSTAQTSSYYNGAIRKNIAHLASIAQPERTLFSNTDQLTIYNITKDAKIEDRVGRLATYMAQEISNQDADGIDIIAVLPHKLIETAAEVYFSQ